MGVTPNGWSIVEHPLKIDELGIPPFQETYMPSCGTYTVIYTIICTIYSKVAKALCTAGKVTDSVLKRLIFPENPNGMIWNDWITADAHSISTDSNPHGTAPMWHIHQYNL